MSRVVHAEKLLAGRFRRVEASYQPVETRGEQPVLDRSEAIGMLGMLLSHLVQEALRVRNEGEAHGPSLPPSAKPSRFRRRRPFLTVCASAAPRLLSRKGPARAHRLRSAAVAPQWLRLAASSPERNGRREPCMVRMDTGGRLARPR